MSEGRAEIGKEPPDVTMVAPSPGVDMSSLSEEEKVSMPEPVRQEPDHTVPMTKTQISIVMCALAISVFLAALDLTIVVPSTPTIASHFQSSEVYIWIGAAFSLANAASGPIWGKLSDIWGRKVLLLTAVSTFLVGSALCGFSTNTAMLLSGRTIQGLGAGGLLNLANICVADLFSMRERPLYYGVFGMIWALASSIGPVLGGVLTERASWRWCFWINLPVSAIAFAIITVFLKLETKRMSIGEGLRAIDWLGSGSLVASTVLVLLGLQFGGITHPWGSATVLCLIVVGLALVPVFVFVERGPTLAKNPIMPPRLFGNVSNISVLVASFVHGSVVMTISYFLILYFQSVLAASPILSGVYLLPFALGISFSSILTGVYTRVTGRYMPAIRFAALLTLLGCGLLIALPLTHQWSKIIIFTMLVGIGAGPDYQALLLALQNNVRPQDIATATSTFMFTRNVASSVGLVVGGVVFQNGMESRQDGLREELGDVAGKFNGKNAEASVGLIGQLGKDGIEAVRRAFWESEKDIWIFATGLAAVGCVAMIGIKGKEMSRAKEVIEMEAGKERGQEGGDKGVEK